MARLGRSAPNSSTLDHVMSYANRASKAKSKNKERPDWAGLSSDLLNWILDSGATCHMTPFFEDFVEGSLVDVDNYIEVADETFVPTKQQGTVRIRMHGDDR